MPLPKIATPTYELELPSTGATVKYRPFLVKEEKVLVIALESEDNKQITNAIKAVLKSCILTKGVRVESLPTFDIEYLFLNIRGKSVGEDIEVNLICPDDGKTQVNRSTVNTIAQFDMGPNIKKGDKLGVISGNMRKKYDMKAASFKPEAYDVVLDYVLSEGHADSVEEAHYVMTQMDEETIKSITEIALGTVAGVAGALTLGGMGINAIRKQLQNKKKMDQGGKFTTGSTMDNIQKKNKMLNDLNTGNY